MNITKENLRRALQLAARIILVWEPDFDIPFRQYGMSDYEQILLEYINDIRKETARPHESAQTHDETQLELIASKLDQKNDT